MPSTRASATLNQINAMDALTEAIRELIQAQIDAARAQTQFHESLRTNNETPAPQEPLPLPEFFGENHEDPQRFLDTCLLRINNDNQEIRLQRIVSQLRGPAKEWWRLNGSLIPTYEDFTAAFLNRYNGVSHLFKLKASLYGDGQRNENVEHFLRRKWLLAKRVAPELPESQLVRLTAGLLTPELAAASGTVFPQSMNDFIEAMIQVEENRKRLPSNHTRQPPSLPKCRFCPGFHFHRDCSAKPPPEVDKQDGISQEKILTIAEEVRQAQISDALTRRLINQRRDMEENPPEGNGWQSGFYKNYCIDNGYLCRRPKNTLYVPAGIKERVLFEHHDATLAGHPGADESERLIRNNFHWPSLRQDVRDYVSTCLLCARFKKRPNQTLAPLRPRRPQRPFETIACDVMGPYPITPRGNRFIVTITDLFTRWVEAYPVQEASAKTIITIFDKEVFARFGYPKNIITDNGPQFTSSRWTKACQRWGCQPWTTATYTPRQNPTERRNQELKKLLKIHLHQKSQLDWDIQLPGILFTLRKRRNAATGQPPSQLLYGVELQFPGEWDGPKAREARPEPEALRQQARRHQ
ncbi:uncharacterized protein LOC135266972 [Tribolium castaneum]|uniref:uncharacterized protein LOC135266972 n=1 Tax=Tribolium castaneum TaxID=7070 RepID=UPI0030FEFA64